jgi:hypothetical protein
VACVTATELRFDVAGETTTALIYKGIGARETLVLAHGAGGHQRHPWMVAVATAVAARAIDVVTFDFLYAHARRRLPDKRETLEATWRAAIEAVRSRSDVAHRRLFIGGKSMGGRIATQVAASGEAIDLKGLVLLGYPLHPPGKPHVLRSAHLPAIAAPMLFVQGSRDPFGGPDELGPIVEKLKSARMLVVEGGDHSLSPLKRSGDSLAQVLGRVADAVRTFCLSSTAVL